MAALIDAIDIKRKMFFEFDNTPFHCLEAEVSTPTPGRADFGSPEDAQSSHPRCV